MRIRLRPLGIQPRQARVLDALERMGEVSQNELADEFGLSAASMSTMTSRLLKADLITQRTDEYERRRNILTLTEQGRSLLQAIYREWREMDREISRAIGVENSKQLACLTYQLRNALGGRTPGGERAQSSAEPQNRE